LRKRLQNIKSKGDSLSLLLALLVIWQLVCSLKLVPPFLLPSPISVVRAFAVDFVPIMGHAAVSLAEAFAGLFLGVAGAFVLAILMDRSDYLYQALYPIILITQTVPTVALAPLLVLWMGYGPAPKIVLVFLVCFFPVAVGLLDGFREADPDTMVLLRSMGANEGQIFLHLKLPGALPRLFSGLRIAVSYAIVGAVIAEWLGGSSGLGVYMTRVRKSYAFDKMFAIIFFVSGLSILLMRLTALLEKKMTPWARQGERKDS
jgi:ABC-type nitrate/sulfonate/bicarbonate transport system permease component